MLNMLWKLYGVAWCLWNAIDELLRSAVPEG